MASHIQPNAHASINSAFANSTDDLLSGSPHRTVLDPSWQASVELVDERYRDRNRVDDREYTVRILTPTNSIRQSSDQPRAESSSGPRTLTSADYDSFSKAVTNASDLLNPTTKSIAGDSIITSHIVSPPKNRKRQELAEINLIEQDDSHSREFATSKRRSTNDILISSSELDDSAFTFDMSNNDRETLPLLRTGERERQRSGSTSEKERLNVQRENDRDSRKRAKGRGRRRASTECSSEPDSNGSAWGNYFADDPAFAAIVKRTEQAILANTYQPERIYQGSSGSYFVRDSTGTRVAVFKPKDEEPYGQLNPKFTKWMHKVCCPCCFGRSCLVPNQGYLSEAGAYLIDTHLQLGVVPPTRIVRLASDSFNYDAIAREKLRIKQQLSSRFPDLGRHFNRVALPPKVGSFQLFVSDYRDADYWLRRFDAEPRLLDGETRREFLSQFQRLVVLDYVIRNTDRGNDNWLIRYDIPTQRNCGGGGDGRGRSPRVTSNTPINRSRSIDALGDARRNASHLPGSAAPGGERIQSTATSESPISPSQSRDLLRFHSPPRDEPVNGKANGALVDEVNREPNSSNKGERDSSKAGSSDSRLVSLSPTKLNTDDLDEADFEYVERARVRIAAIDNGLAFPFKHPDEVRSYPFGWSWLAIAKEPFQDEVCELVLPKLEQSNIDELCVRLRTLFRTDRGFDAHTFERQLDVLRGQILNLRRALRERYSPAQLVTMPAALVHTDGTDSRQSFRKRNPFFSCW